MSPELLEVHSLCKCFRTKENGVVRAVDNVSFTISEGKTLGLVGESGCGKTTLAKTLMRLYVPDKGRVCFQGRDINRIDKTEILHIRKKMQMVFQEPKASLNPYLTIRETLSDGLKIHSLCTSKTEEMDHVNELLKSVGLNYKYANCYPHALSGGQQQRVGIARALALKPQLIVCDEIVSALDVSMQAQIINLLLQQQQEHNIAYLFISHDLPLVEHISDEIAVMYGGMIIEYGGAHEIIRHPLHPYTQRLVSSILKIGHKLEAVPFKENIIGAPLEEGCIYSRECQYASETCKNNKPRMYALEDGHLVRCFR